MLILNLTSISPVYTEDPSIHQKAASFLNHLLHSQSDPDILGVRGLISELKPVQHNLHLSLHN